MKIDQWHARLTMMKNTAYAWRQMIFLLSFLPSSAVEEFLAWAQGHFGEQTEAFRQRFEPALRGLALVASGQPGEQLDQASDAQRFLGWCNTRHWLMPAGQA